MHLTDSFIYIHFPKTGGTFVKYHLSRLMERYGIQDEGNKYHEHVKYSTIDKEDRKDRVVISTIRNPYDLMVSEYLFGHVFYNKDFLKNHSHEFKRRNQNYPNLSFEETVKLLNSFPHDKNKNTEIGYLSERFLKFFSFDLTYSDKITDNDILTSEYYKKLPTTWFWKQDDLNNELYNFCVNYLNMDPEDREVMSILSSKEICPKMNGGIGERTRSNKDRWENYFSYNFMKYIRYQERLIFAMFPEYDVFSVEE